MRLPYSSPPPSLFPNTPSITKIIQAKMSLLRFSMDFCCRRTRVSSAPLSLYLINATTSVINLCMARLPSGTAPR